METITENIEKKNNSLQGIRTVKEGKRFESYVGWGFSKELECEQYIQGADFSFQFEKIQIENILTQQKLEEDEKKKILSDLTEFENGIKYLKPGQDKNNSGKSESKTDNKKSITTSSEDINQNKIISINTDKNINNNTNTNNNMNLIDNNINNINIDKNKAKEKKEKKNKKNKPKINKKDDISGDFDIIIPNVKKEKFENLLKKNFHYGEEMACIVLQKEKIKELPSCFHLFIETGLNAFNNEMAHKTKQIKKYISIINMRNAIVNDKIKKIYIEDFQRRFSLDLNSDKINIAQDYVYMLISNSDYQYFAQRFFNNKSFKKDEFQDEINIAMSSVKDEFVFYGYVYFEKYLNSHTFVSMELEKQNNSLISKLKIDLDNKDKAWNKKIEERVNEQIKKQKEDWNKQMKKQMEEQMKKQMEEQIKKQMGEQIKKQKEEEIKELKQQIKVLNTNFLSKKRIRNILIIIIIIILFIIFLYYFYYFAYGSQKNTE